MIAVGPSSISVPSGISSRSKSSRGDVSRRGLPLRRRSRTIFRDTVAPAAPMELRCSRQGNPMGGLFSRGSCARRAASR